MSKLRIGVVGVGKHGSRYAKHAAEDVDAIELVAVCRRDELKGREIADRYRCEYVSDARALVERRDLDVVVLATLPSLLEELVTAAVSTGKRLLVEKPVAPDVATGVRILRVIESAGAYCLAGHTLRFNRVVTRMRELIDTVGRIDSLTLTQRFPPQLALDWLDDPARSGGGNILHTGVHCFDLARWLTGLEPAEASCTTASVYTRATEDNFVCWLRFRDSDMLTTVACSRTTRGRNGFIEIGGEHGQLVGDHVLHTLYRLGCDGREDVALAPAAHTVLEALRQLVVDARDDAAPRASYRDGLVALATADACYRSALSRRAEPVVLPELGL